MVLKCLKIIAQAVFWVFIFIVSIFLLSIFATFDNSVWYTEIGCGLMTTWGVWAARKHQQDSREYWHDRCVTFERELAAYKELNSERLARKALFDRNQKIAGTLTQQIKMATDRIALIEAFLADPDSSVLSVPNTDFSDADGSAESAVSDLYGDE